jgi:hypothetical protein
LNGRTYAPDDLVVEGCWERLGHWGWRRLSDPSACQNQHSKPLRQHPHLIFSIKVTFHSDFLLEVWQESEAKDGAFEGSAVEPVGVRLQGKTSPPRKTPKEELAGRTQISEACWDAAAGLADFVDLDYLQQRWVAQVLWNGASRRWQPVVWEKYVSVVSPSVGEKELEDLDTSTKTVLLDVRWGDDLELIAAWHGLRYGFEGGGVKQLAAKFKVEIPQHRDAKWTQSRRMLLPPALRQLEIDKTKIENVVAVDGWNFDPLLFEVQHPQHSEHDESSCITLAITTCKRHAMFKTTVESILELLKVGLLHVGFPSLCRRGGEEQNYKSKIFSPKRALRIEGL